MVSRLFLVSWSQTDSIDDNTPLQLRIVARHDLNRTIKRGTPHLFDFEKINSRKNDFSYFVRHFQHYFRSGSSCCFFLHEKTWAQQRILKWRNLHYKLYISVSSKWQCFWEDFPYAWNMYFLLTIWCWMMSTCTSLG